MNDFNYLGSKIISSEKDIQVRIGSAWSALNKLTPVWKLNLDVSIKTEFFIATVESVLTYGSQAWKLKKSIENKLNGAYTRMLRAALNFHWSQRVTNKELYNDLPKITETIRYCRSKFLGHIWRHDEEFMHNLLFWMPTNGKNKRGRPQKLYIDQLIEDTGLQMEELKTFETLKEEWKSFINSNFPSE